MIGIFLFIYLFIFIFLREHYRSHDKLVSKIDYFQILSMVQSIFIRLGEGEEGYRIWRIACDVMAAMLVDRNKTIFVL